MRKSVTLKDVASLAGTSTAAVSATISGNSSGSVRISQETQQRIKEAAKTLGYAPNPVARSLSTGKSGVIGLVFPYVNAFVDRNPFCSMIMNGVFTEAIIDRFNVMLYTMEQAIGSSSQIDPRVDGIVQVLPVPNDTLLKACLDSGFPCVAVVFPNLGGKIMTVNADDYKGGYIATKHLIDLGHRRIAMLTGTEEISTSSPRFHGYRDALADAGITIDEALIVQSGFNMEPGYQSMLQLLALPSQSQPTAVFAVNDLCAVGAMQAMKANGISIPHDMAIVGFDDSWLTTTVQPALTSVRMPIKEMGALAVKMLTAKINATPIENQNVVLDVSLTVRASCGASPDFVLPEIPDPDSLPL